MINNKTPKCYKMTKRCVFTLWLRSICFIPSIIMSKCLSFFKRRNKKPSRSPLCGALDNPVSPREEERLRSPQSASPSSEVILTFKNGNFLTLKKQAMHPESTEKGTDATRPRLLLPIIVVLGGSEFQRKSSRRKRTEYRSSFVWALCVRKTDGCHGCCGHSLDDCIALEETELCFLFALTAYWG